MAGGPASVHTQVGGADGSAFTEVDLHSWPKETLPPSNPKRGRDLCHILADSSPPPLSIGATIDLTQ